MSTLYVVPSLLLWLCTRLDWTMQEIPIQLFEFNDFIIAGKMIKYPKLKPAKKKIKKNPV